VDEGLYFAFRAGRPARFEGGLKMSAILEVEDNAPALEDYFGMSEAELYERIEAARRKLGKRLLILGHHYQRDDVICHADITGEIGRAHV